MAIPKITRQAKLEWGGHPCPPTAESKNAQSGNSRSGFLFAICALLILAPFATAQRTAHATAPPPAIPHFNSPTANFAFGRAAHPFRFQRSFPYTSLPFPFFADSFNPEDIYSTGYPVASQPPIIVLQAARTLIGTTGYLSQTENDRIENDRAPSRPEPLMIELQNGRYVRLTSTPANEEPLSLANNKTLAGRTTVWGQPPRERMERALLPADAASPPAHDLPPALLIFRDGHSEEVRDYTIADGILYARGNYYTDGYWNKNIALSNLNVPETLQANASRSIKFVLPSSPNEVVTRP